MFRSREIETLYVCKQKRRKNELRSSGVKIDEAKDAQDVPKQNCGFCNMPKDEVLEEYEHFYRAIALYPYDFWDRSTVTKHELLIPKRHISTLSDLNDAELLEHAKLIAGFERKGVSIYSKGWGSHMKSVAHQHTHLFTLERKDFSGFFFWEKPYIRIFG